MKKTLKNPFEQAGNWYKANFHAHTTTSDGALSVTDRVAQYRKAGYNILALTDHDTTNDIHGVSDKKMLVISGMEYHPTCPSTPMVYHIVGLNIPHGFKLDDPKDAKRCIAQVKKAGGESVLAHPYWSGQSYESFRDILDEFVAVEVYNSTCDRHGKPSSESEWAYCLDNGHILPAIGNDDVHCAAGEDVCECWTWLKLPSLSVKNVLTGLRRGMCYVSCGPRISDFKIKDGKVCLHCSAAAKIYFIGGPGCLGIRRRAEKGKSIKSFSINVPDWPYVRAVVTDKTGQRAWTNPIILEGKSQ